MHRINVTAGFSILLLFAGCVSAERKAEYAAWQASDDGVQTVMLGEFEAKYQQGWRERAAEKKKARLAREEAERVLAERKAEYDLWLVSDDKEDGISFEVFEQKYKEGWEDRAAQKKQARLEREEKERQEAKRKAELAELQRKRDEVRDAMAARMLADIREAYARGSRYQHVYYNLELLRKLWKEKKGSDAYRELYRELDNRKASDWLKELVAPRLGLSEEDRLAGEALLSEFGNKFMPNAYANYEKMRDAALELQQVFNEEFPKPWEIKNTSPKWNSFNKVLEKFVMARTEYFMCHDELCHFWISYRLGVLTAEDFARIDAQKVAARLLPENTSCAACTIVDCRKLDEKDAEFAAKYAPESYAVYQSLEQEWKQSAALVGEVEKQRLQLDSVRFDRAYYNAVFKLNDLAREINMLVPDFQTWHVDHRTTMKSSEDVAKCDQERAKGLKSFVDSLPTYIKDRTLGRVIPGAEMVLMPDGEVVKEKSEWGRWSKHGNWKTDRHDVERKWKETTVMKGLRVQRTEVTQMQWMLVTGNNPSKHIQPDCPVENVSWDDCQAFIKKLNEIDGTTYRLPKEVEWEYACRAGSTGDWGKRRNGEEGPLEAMGWYDKNGGRDPHPVAQKEPNAWGLYDMHGNVWEWCEDKYEPGNSDRVCRGGSWYAGAGSCSASSRGSSSPDSRDINLGFRLASSQD